MHPILAGVLQKLGLRESETDEVHGPEAIALARQELTRDDQPEQAEIGLARLEDLGGEFSNDPKAVIPLRLHDPYQDPAPLTLDVDGEQLAEFCEAFGVELHDLDTLQGETVPILWSQGQPSADWLRLLRPDEADDGRGGE